MFASRHLHNFTDEDQDKVALSTDAELELAWREIRESGAQFRLYVHIN